MYKNNGVGLAAPQVGISLRIFVIDVSTDEEPLNPIVFINPRIIKREGGVISHEGCLSFPEVFINVKRSERVIVKAKDYKNRPFTMDVGNGTLLCRAIQHEFDHLNSVLFIDHTINRFEVNNALQEKQLPLIEEKYLLDEPDLDQLIAENISNESDIKEEFKENNI